MILTGVFLEKTSPFIRKKLVKIFTKIFFPIFYIPRPAALLESSGVAGASLRGGIRSFGKSKP